MYKVTYPGGIGLRHVASRFDQHRVAPKSERAHPANIAQGTAVECNMRVLKQIGSRLVAFARLSDGSGWIFTQKGDDQLVELIAHDYSAAGGPTDEASAAELGEGGAERAGDIVPVPAEELEASAAAEPPAGAAAERGEEELDEAAAAVSPARAPKPAPPREALGEVTNVLSPDGERESESMRFACALQLRGLSPRAWHERGEALTRPCHLHLPARAAMERVKISSANLHAAAAYSSIGEKEEMGVVDAVSSLSRIWPSSFSA